VKRRQIDEDCNSDHRVLRAMVGVAGLNLRPLVPNEVSFPPKGWD
jgi:hypothetical protein